MQTCQAHLDAQKPCHIDWLARSFLKLTTDGLIRPTHALFLDSLELHAFACVSRDANMARQWASHGRPKNKPQWMEARLNRVD